MVLLYVLSHYAESGAEHMSATLNPQAVPAMLDVYPKVSDSDRATLARLLIENCPGQYDLSDGWGGYQLHIVELDSEPHEIAWFRKRCGVDA